MKVRAIIGALILTVSLACAGLAADAPKVSLEAKNITFADAMADVGKQAGVQIVCDSDVKTTVSGQFTSIDLEKLMGTLTEVNGLVWQKLYLSTPDKDKLPTLTEIKARAAAVAALSGGTIVVRDSTGKERVFVEQDATTPSVDPGKLGLKVVYLITKPKAADAVEVKKDETPTSLLMALENQRMQLMLNMTSEERISGLQGQMKAVMDLDPANRRQMITDQFTAMHTMMQDPQYRQVMQDTMQSMREDGTMPEGGWGGHRGGGGGSGTRGGGGGGNRGGGDTNGE